MKARSAATLLIVLLTTGAGVLAQGNPAPPDATKLQHVMNAWATLDPAKAAVFYAKDPGLVFYDFLPRKYTGWAAYDPAILQLLGLGNDERITGFIHIGTPKLEAPERERPDPAALLSDWTPA